MVLFFAFGLQAPLTEPRRAVGNLKTVGLASQMMG